MINFIEDNIRNYFNLDGELAVIHSWALYEGGRVIITIDKNGTLIEEEICFHLCPKWVQEALLA